MDRGFNLDITIFHVKTVIGDMVILTLIHKQIEPLEKHIVVGRQNDLLTVARQLQQDLHEQLHQFRIHV